MEHRNRNKFSNRQQLTCSKKIQLVDQSILRNFESLRNGTAINRPEGYIVLEQHNQCVYPLHQIVKI